MLALSTGLYTPPVGPRLFTATSIVGNRIGSTVAALPPFYLVATGVTLPVAFFPWLSLALLCAPPTARTEP